MIPFFLPYLIRFQGDLREENPHFFQNSGRQKQPGPLTLSDIQVSEIRPKSGFWRTDFLISPKSPAFSMTTETYFRFLTLMSLKNSGKSKQPIFYIDSDL